MNIKNILVASTFALTSLFSMNAVADQVNDELIQFIEIYKKELPVELDECTIMNDVSYRNRTLYYEYKVAANCSYDGLEQRVTKEICANSNVKALLEADVKLNYSYINNDLKRLSFVLTLNSCANK